MAERTIAVIGAGFSGTLLALHLLDRSAAGTHVVLIERHRQFGRGPAYASHNPHHLLNVPAGRMSAFHDRPGDFVAWLRTQPDQNHAPQAFVPRGLFGSYVRHLLNEEMKRQEPRERLELVRGEVLGLERTDSKLRLTLDRNRELESDLAVLATGNFPPEPPSVADPAFYDTSMYKSDPWAADTLQDLDPAAPVLLIGTGLTMVDIVMSLLQQNHAGPIHALSRRGLLPLRHISPPPLRTRRASSPLPSVLLDLLVQLRRDARLAMSEGSPWQPVIDSLRPFTHDIWQALSWEDRARFLRHLRPWWDVHRHRLPTEVADRIDETRRSGQLNITAGRLRSFAVQGNLVEARYHEARARRMASTTAARVINCSGPNCDYARITHPLVRSLLSAGTVRPDRLKLGLDVTNNCALIDAKGRISQRIYAIGPVTKGAFWEMTAVPDLRRQCEGLARHLAQL